MPVTPIATPDTAVTLVNSDGAGAMVILCEHASYHIPARYKDLGLSTTARHSHAAWDPGAMAVARILSQRQDAPLIAGAVSRLVYDCNRPPTSPDAMPARSERIDVPGNRALSPDDRLAREIAVYRPFCAAVSAVLDQRRAARQATLLVTIHSFTPVYHGKPRAVELGILHDADQRAADLMLAAAPSLPHRTIARNQPYGPADGVTHSLRLHGLARALPNVMIEIRNDLITDRTGQETLAEEVSTLLAPVLAELPGAAWAAGHA